MPKPSSRQPAAVSTGSTPRRGHADARTGPKAQRTPESVLPADRRGRSRAYSVLCTVCDARLLLSCFVKVVCSGKRRGPDGRLGCALLCRRSRFMAPMRLSGSVCLARDKAACVLAPRQEDANGYFGCIGCQHVEELTIDGCTISMPGA